MIITKFEEIFQYEKFPVEYECFKQMQSYSGEGVTYVAVPWTQIMNSSWLNFPNKRPTEQYFKELSDIVLPDGNNVTVCQHDDYMQLIPLFKHMNIKKVFSPLHNIGNRDTGGILVLPISFTCSFNFEERDAKDIDMSFVGTTTSHSIRHKMSQRINGPGIIYRNEYHVDSNFFFVEDYKKDKENEFKDILERSRFSICPRGSSPSSVRFWESLAAEAIPILISDYWALPEWNWDDTIIRIPEQEFENMNYESLESIIKDISEEKENQMRLNCKNAYQKFGQHNFGEYILSNTI
jgi:hypothetical protein